MPVQQEGGNDDILEEENYGPEGTLSDDDDHLDEMLWHAEGNRNMREYDKFKVLMGDSEKPLFVGCKHKYTKMSAVYFF